VRLESDTPILAAMLLERPHSEAARLFRDRVDIRAAYTAPAPQVALEPTAVHDPDPAAWVRMRQARLEGGH
jgi:hypothetical protein